MGLFGNKDKKNTAANSANKAQIIAQLTGIQMACRNADVVTLLRNIQTELQGQGETSREEVLTVDYEIKQLLTEANTYILKQQYSIASTKLNKALDKAIDRHQYCVVGGQLDKRAQKEADRAAKRLQEISKETVKSRVEELQSQIDEKTALLDSYKREYEGLQKLRAQNPANSSINAQLMTITTKAKALQTQINNLSIELSKENVDTSISEIAKINEEVVQGRTYTDAEMEINRAKVASQNEQFKETQSQISSGMDLLGVSAEATFNPFAAGDPFAVSDPFAMSDPFATSNSFATNTDTQQQNQYGTFDAGAVGSVDMANDIKKTSRAIQNSIDNYTDKIDDANDDLEDYNAQLRPLLQRRETASPSDCLVLDGQIDQINSKRNSVVYKIKRYRQVVAQLNDKLSLLDKLSTQQDLSATNAQIEQLTSGRFSDFSGLAMFLNDAVKESNEQLEEIGMAVSVAESEDIFMNSATGAQATLTDATTTKDEHKYDALKQELAATPMMR